jgi:hypothetical protein
LHKPCIACSFFRGKDINNVHQPFRDSLQELYDQLYDIDADAREASEDYYTAIS